MLHNRKRKATFELFVTFVKEEAKKANDPIFGRVAMSQYVAPKYGSKIQPVSKPSWNKPRPNATYASNLTDEQSLKKETCAYCHNEHFLGVCKKFERLVHDKKINFLKGKGFCYGCLKKGHMKSKCRNRLNCEKCSMNHPSILHLDFKPTSLKENKPENPPHEIKMSASTIDSSPMEAGNQLECTMAIIAVKVKTKNGLHFKDTYAFLDPGSNVSFISSHLLWDLGIQGTSTKIKLETMGNSITLASEIVKDLEIYSHDFSDSIRIPKLYSKDKMPVNERHIPTSKDVERWNHLKNLPIPHPDCKIGLLIGNNVPDAFTPKEVITGPRNSPHAALTALGYILWNVIRYTPTKQDAFNVNFIDVVSENEQLNQLDRMVRLSTSFDFPEKLSNEKEEHSIQDKRFIEMVESSIKLKDQHYEINLPFKDNEIVLPDTRKMVLNRLNSLRSKLKRNKEFYNDYLKFMTTILDKGYAEQVPPEEVDQYNPKKWYIPHHGVYHKQKNKIRVVFDCSAKHQGVSLNEVLIGGPHLANDLVAVLIRFRLGKIGIMGDIEAMYHQVKVPVKDRDSLRFFWWRNGNLDTEPTEYRMSSHLFESVSSPAIANFALQRTALDFEDRFNKEVRDTILLNFYVDDCLKSVDEKASAIEMVKKLKEICSLAGFNIHKWISNDNDVMKSIPESERASSIQLSFGNDDSIMERALGVNWCVNSDTLTFKIDIKDKPKTRRGMLSVIASVFDPLGFAAPALLPLKLLLQELSQKGFGWDQPLDDNHQQLWTKWVEDLPTLETIKIPRCVKSQNFGKLVKAELHVFSDACQRGYGVVCYLRLIDDKGTISCSLVMGKSRVCPLKKVTIPRLELTAATTAVKLTKKIEQELLSMDLQTTYWTDSTAVLYYISNEESRYKTFVANRVALIRGKTNVSQWKYINTVDNPADEASRGLTVESLVKSDRWFNGPAFLRKPQSEWPEYQYVKEPSTSLESETKKSTNAVVINEEHPLDKLLSYFSSLIRVKRAVAWLKWITRALKKKIQLKRGDKSNATTSILTVENLKEAEELLITHEQKRYFGNIEDGSSKIFKEKQMMKLNPCVLNRLLRVGGRLERSTLFLDAKHQIILPKQSRLSELLIRHAHECVGHLGNNSTISELRKKYWIFGASTIIKSIVSRCTTCRKHSAKTNKQKMANLPANRISPGGMPFEHTGLDFFGPLEIKQRRTKVKRY